MEQTIITKISKAGDNLFARIPQKNKGEISRGDTVKITIIEKKCTSKPGLKQEINNFLNNPNGTKLKTTILGYNIQIPITKIINKIPKNEITKILYEALTE